jgi:DNA-binding NarL/FixJ family response regulator
VNSDRVFRVLLVDDHPITRRGIRALVEAQPDFQVCGEASDDASALALVASTSPHVAVVDISLGGADGLKLVRKLKAAAAQTQVLVLSMHEETIFASRAKAAGAAGYVMKQHASDTIIAAIRQVLAAEPKQPSIAEGNRRLRKAARGGVELLSARELEVLRAIGDGFATREIAARLGVSAKTIDTHREHLKLKLQMRDGVELVQFAIQWAHAEAHDRRERPPG